MEFAKKSKYGFDDLKEIVRILRAPDGCPWDREQTHESIRKNLIEETYEVIEAIDNSDTSLLREELGDLLLQVALHSEMESEAGSFDIDDVCDDLCKKLIVRHPHVFGDKSAQNAEEALSNWDAVKMQTKEQKSYTQAMESVCKALPALMRSEKIQRKSAKAGMDFESIERAVSKLNEECTELEVAIKHGTQQNRYEEIGDVQALYDACDKFIKRFSAVEQIAAERGIDMTTAPITQLDSLWDEVKIKLKENNGGNLS